MWARRRASRASCSVIEKLPRLSFVSPADADLVGELDADLVHVWIYLDAAVFHGLEV
jgi:hypothetical protein